MKHFITFGLLLCSSFFLSCGDSTVSSGWGTPKLINFDSRATLVYRVEYKDMFDNPILGFDTIRFNPITINFDSVEWHTPIHSSQQFEIPEFFPFMANGEDGVWIRHDFSDEAIRLFKYPAFVGERYSYFPGDTIKRPDEYLWHGQMTGTASVKVGNTTYLTNVYEYIVSGGHEAQWRKIYIAPGFTIVKGIYITSRSSSFDTATYQIVP